MSERLYMINPLSETYICMGKSFGRGYDLGNVPLLEKFMKKSDTWSGLKIVPEEKLPLDYQNFNDKGLWEVYEPDSST